LQIIGSYQEAFKPLGLRLLTSGKPGNVAHLAVLLLPISIDRDEFRNNMRNLGVETDVHYPLLDTEQIGLNMGDFPGQIPNSQELVNKIVSIPIFPQMTLSEMSTVIDAVIGSVNKSE
jgi:dTDP-4-amino-4,6-dideoxygalactose transaminase